MIWRTFSTGCDAQITLDVLEIASFGDLLARLQLIYSNRTHRQIMTSFGPGATHAVIPNGRNDSILVSLEILFRALVFILTYVS